MVCFYVIFNFIKLENPWAVATSGPPENQRTNLQWPTGGCHRRTAIGLLSEHTECHSSVQHVYLEVRVS